jgi:hypothetical protein
MLLESLDLKMLKVKAKLKKAQNWMTSNSASLSNEMEIHDAASS